MGRAARAGPDRALHFALPWVLLVWLWAPCGRTPRAEQWPSAPVFEAETWGPSAGQSHLFFQTPWIFPGEAPEVGDGCWGLSAQERCP